VVDKDGSRVQVIGADGLFLFRLGQNGSRKGQIQQVTGLAVNGERIALMDSARKAVLFFDPQGKFLNEIANDPGKAPVWSDLADMDSDEEGRFFILDRAAKRVRLFSPQGRFISDFFVAGHRLDCGTNGRLALVTEKDIEIYDVSIVPARTTGCVKSDAEEVAARIAEELGYIGTMGVEFFVSRGRLIVNEMAPRPHNSGHYTIDACVTNQFEQQVRALCGLPLGEPRAHSAAVMVNLLGDLWYEDGNPSGTYREPDWSKLYAFHSLKLHLYGKHHARPGRKMGHVNMIEN